MMTKDDKIERIREAYESGEAGLEKCYLAYLKASDTSPLTGADEKAVSKVAKMGAGMTIEQIAYLVRLLQYKALFNDDMEVIDEPEKD